MQNIKLLKLFFVLTLIGRTNDRLKKRILIFQKIMCFQQFQQILTANHQAGSLTISVYFFQRQTVQEYQLVSH